MPDKIYVTYTPTSFPDAFHTAIHYERRDADGRLIKHIMVEVQPEAKGASAKAMGVLEEALRRGNDVTRLGRMNARVVDMMRPASREDVDPNAPYEVIAEGDDLSPHLDRMRFMPMGSTAQASPIGETIKIAIASQVGRYAQANFQRQRA